MCLHSWHDSPLCLAAPSGQPPKPAGSRRRREGLTAKARAERQSSDNGCLAGAPPRQAEIRQERELVDLLFLSSSIFQSGSPSDRRDVGVAFDALDIQESPLLNLCDTRRINLYPVGLEPKPRSLMQHCEGRKGLQGGWDPSLRRRLAATPPGGHASTLDWYVPLVSLQDSMFKSTFQNGGRRHHAGSKVAPQGDQ